MTQRHGSPVLIVYILFIALLIILFGFYFLAQKVHALELDYVYDSPAPNESTDPFTQYEINIQQVLPDEEIQIYIPNEPDRGEGETQYIIEED